MTDCSYDAILVVSFGGPEGPDDVIPFLENVLRGRNVPRERMLEVAEHYNHFGGVSPINQQCRDLIGALESELAAHEIEIPIHWGNRNWHPFLPETVSRLYNEGARRVLAFVTSGFSCYSGCRQYRENIRDAVAAEAPDMQVDRLRVVYNHPDFIAVHVEHLRQAIGRLPEGREVHIAFTAHSIPMSMAESSDYEQQLRETARLVCEEAEIPESNWQLVWQSRSGRPQDPWLEPDICDHIDDLAAAHSNLGMVVAPIGFLSDHMEVLYDLDDEARTACEQRGVPMERAATPGTHPRFIQMIRSLIQERIGQCSPSAIGRFGPNHDVCPQDCCPAPVRPGRPASAGKRPSAG